MSRLRLFRLKRKGLCVLLVCVFAVSMLASLFMLSMPVLASPPTSNSAFIAYRSNVSPADMTIPRYRTWSVEATIWTDESSLPTGGSNVRWVRVAYCTNATRREERIVVNLCDDGNLDAYVWNGTGWMKELNIGSTGVTVNVYRAFDVAYEKTTGIALLVYSKGSSSDPEIGYKKWNGKTWSSESTLNLPTDVAVNWVALASKPTSGSNEIVLATMGGAAANGKVAAAVWTGGWAGGSWGSTTTITSTLNQPTKEGIAVAYEQQSGKAMVVCGQAAVANYARYCVWSGSAWGSILDVTSVGGTISWLSLKAAPGSNRLMFTSIDEGSDLNTVQWDGSAWGSTTEHDASVDYITARCADFEWSSDGTYGVLLYGDGSGNLVSKKFTLDGTWSAGSNVLTSGSRYWVQLRRTRFSQIVGATLDADNDIDAYHFVGGGSWLRAADLTTDTGVTLPGYECFEIESPPEIAAPLESPLFLAYRGALAPPATNPTQYPRFRTWSPDTNTTSPETYLSDSGSPIRWIRVAYCPNVTRREERIVVTLSEDGELDAYVWTGTTWSVTNNIGSCWGVSPVTGQYRPYDIAYEPITGRALLVYDIDVADASKDLAYKIWNGVTWGAEQYINLGTVVTTNPPVGYVSMATANYTQIAMIFNDYTAEDVIAAIWDGSTWQYDTAITTAQGATSKLYESFAIVYAQYSKKILAVAGQGADLAVGKYFSQASHSWTALTSWDPDDETGNDVAFVSLKADPDASSASTDYIMMISSNDLSDLDVDVFRADTWAFTEWDADDAISAYATRNFDFEWEHKGHKGLLVWDTETTYLQFNTFTAPNTWADGTFASTSYRIATDAVLHPWVQLRRPPFPIRVGTERKAPQIMGATLDAGNDIDLLQWDGTTLTRIPDITIDTGTTTYECFEMEFQRVNPKVSLVPGKTITLKPNAEGSLLGWTATGTGATHFDRIKEWSLHDGDTSYLRATARWLNETTNVEDPSSSLFTLKITSVRVGIVARTETAATDDMVQMFILIGGTRYWNTTQYTLKSTSYYTFTCEWFTNPRTGADWTWADIKALEPGFMSIQIGVAFTSMRVTQLYVEVDAGDTNFADTSLTPQTAVTLRPNADGYFTDWTGDYTMWDEATANGDTDYVKATADYQIETSDLDDPSAPGPTWPIAGVRVNVVARNTDPLSDEQFAIALYHPSWGLTECWGKSFTPTTTYTLYTSEWSMNPQGPEGNPNYRFWTWNDIKDLQAGVASIVKTSWTGEIRVTQLYVEVVGPRLHANVMVDYVPDLWIYEYELTYDPSLVRGVNTLEGSECVREGKSGKYAWGFIASSGGTVTVIPGAWNNEIGKLTRSGAWVGSPMGGLATPLYTPDGWGTLSTAVFWVVAKGETKIYLGDGTSLGAEPPPSPNPIALGRTSIKAEDGYFRNIDPYLIPRTSFTIAGVGTPGNQPLENYNVDFTSTSTAAPGKTLSKNEWYFWEVCDVPIGTRRLMDFTDLTLSPNLDGYYTGWSIVPGTPITHFDKIDDWPSHDTDTTYVKATSGGLDESVALQNHGTETWTIGKVKVTIAAKATAVMTAAESDRVQIMLVIGGAGAKYYGADVTPSTSYATYTSEWTTNPATTAAWTWSDIDNLEAGVRSTQVGASFTEMRVTQLYVEVFQTSTLDPLPFDLVTRNYTRRGTWYTTLTVTDSDGTVGTMTKTFTVLAHDIYFTSIVTNATHVLYPTTLAVNIGQIIEINATVINEGDFTETNVNVSCFWGIFISGAYQYGSIGSTTGLTLAPKATQLLTYNWDTTLRNVTHPDTYVIHVNASKVPYESDTERGPGKIADNQFSSSDHRIRFRDVSVTSVTVDKTSVTQGEIVTITVVVRNDGDYNETITSVTAYYDSNTAGQNTTTIKFSNKTFSDERYSKFGRPANYTATYIFSWNTAGVPGGTYTIKGTVNTVPGEYDTTDNTKINGTVQVTTGVPEFPLGAAIEIFLAALIVYIFLRKTRTRTDHEKHTSLKQVQERNFK